MNRHSPLDRLVTIAMALSFACVGCEREERNLHTAPFQAATAAVADEAWPEVRGTGSGDASLVKHYESNAYAVSQGKRLFTLYNCSGCHAQGGGASGPALMDDLWIYGAEPEVVFASIARGRPNGMPSFGSRMPEYQVWQLVAYVRSMTGLIAGDAAPGRNDAMQGKPSEQLADEQPPRLVGAISLEPAK